VSDDGILIANRGEIAIRIIRSVLDLGLRPVALCGDDDHDAPHARMAPDVVRIPAAGNRPYLDAEAIVEAAAGTGCTAIHPGYGFLSEQADFAQHCTDRGITFIGPSPGVLATFGDKTRARELARRLGITVLPGTHGPTSLEAARAFMEAHDGPVVVKARSGGGGRGLRIVDDIADLPAAFERCRSEALSAFGDGELYVERLVPRARHVEVQIAGDHTGAVTTLGDRDCSIQRLRQKLIEIAPSPRSDTATSARLTAAAVAMAAELGYQGLGTVEFLVDLDTGEAVFLEANPRIQVEHTVTEEVTGLDLVAIQILLAWGATLDDLGIETPATPTGTAIQARVYAERIGPGGARLPSAGTLTRFEAPTGPGIRVDHAAGAGVSVHPAFDPLVAKIVARGSTPALAWRRLAHALDETVIEGVDTNLALLRAVAARPEHADGGVTTRFIDDHLDELLPATAPRAPGPHGASVVAAPTVGTVVAVDVSEGDEVAAGGQLVVIESMKMEHVVTATTDCRVARVLVRPGDTVDEGQPLLDVDPSSAGASPAAPDLDQVDLDWIRPDLRSVLDRHAVGLDEARPDAVARRHDSGHRTARENLADLVDAGSFVEYGPLAIAAQRRRRDLQELIERTPADGLVGGIGRINGDRFGPERSQCVVMSYDYTVLAGTQGHHNHMKKDRLFEIAETRRLPVVLLAEGGGGRPGDTDVSAVSGLATMAFHLFGRLSGTVPLVGVVAGRCFAGNAALLGCCDVIIATQSATIGMGGPAMIEGGGLGVVEPDEIGPLSVQVPNGVVDIPVTDEAEAVAVAKRYLAYFQGPLDEWECPDQRLLRHLVPENRVRVYDVRRVVDTLADSGSALELRQHFGVGIITALVRIEGRPMGLLANNPAHLGGAIDHDAADKAARFMQLCDTFGLPIVSLCDTPGFMVGPESEKAATVRHFSRMFVNGANLDVPIGTVILRKAYGLGAQAMAGGSFKTPLFTVAWPTGELGGMGLEGAVKLAYRRELDAVEDPTERQALYDEMVARMYERGTAQNAASVLEIDDVIDPADTRHWITSVLSTPERPAGSPPRRPCIDTW
jgi:acetyl/propionyl-CoA carboxylase alpha subunit/acetyl-CoA carboxylase carboxyltransferase component